MNRKNNFNQGESNIYKGLIAGIVGGLVASFVMNKFQAGWSAISESLTNEDGENNEEKSKANKKSDEQKPEQEPATVKAAEMVSEEIFDRELTGREKKYAGPAVHYATGGGSAAVYGAAAEFVPEVTAGMGLPFGTAVWLTVDEGAVPLLGLSKSPLKYPPSTHIYGLVSHLVYGLTTEIVRRAVRSRL